MKKISYLFIIISLVSCKSASCVQEFGSSEVQDVQKFRSVDTVVLRDSVYIYERMKGDTVYLTRTEWRERWRTKIVHDTIRNTEYVTQTIESPPQRYVPKFYKHCTTYFWCIVVLFLLYIVFRLTKSKL